MKYTNALIVIVLILVISLSVFAINRCNIEKYDNLQPGTLKSTNYPDRDLRSTVNTSRQCVIYYVPEKYNFNGQILDMTIACDMPYFNKFNKPVDMIQYDLNKINNKNNNSLTNEEELIKKYGPAVISIKNNKTAELNIDGKGYCKMDTLGNNGWIEIVKDEYGNLYPKKNLANPLLSTKGPAESWSHCYKKIPGSDTNPNANYDQTAVSMVKSVSDCTDIMTPNCAVLGNPTAIQNPSPLNDNNAYAKVTFKTLKLSSALNNKNIEGFVGSTQEIDNIYNNPGLNMQSASILNQCNLGLKPPSGIPGYYIEFGFSGNVNSSIISSFRLVNLDSYKMRAYPSSMSYTLPIDTTSREAINVYNNLFTNILFENRLYLIPDNFTVDIYKFFYEPCVIDNNTNTQQINYDQSNGKISGLTFSLKNSILKGGKPAIPAISLYTFDPKLLDSKYWGNLDFLKTQSDSIDRDIKSKQPNLPQYTAPSNLRTGQKIVTIDSTAIYQGVEYSLYSIDKNGNIGNNGNSNASAIALDKLISDGSLKRSGTISSVNIYQSSNTQANGIAIVLSGYIKINISGTYNFIINCEKSGDLKITHIITKNGIKNTQNDINNYWDIPVDENSILASYNYGSNSMNDTINGISNTKYQLLTGDILKFTARFVNTTGNSGIQLFWLTPDKQQTSYKNCAPASKNNIDSNNLGTLPDINACYVQIPDSQIFYSTDNYEKDNEAIAENNHLTKQLNNIKGIILAIEANYNAYVLKGINNILNSELIISNLDIVDGKSTNYKLYMYIGDFENPNGLVPNPNIISGNKDPNVDVPIQQNELDISNLNDWVLSTGSPVGNIVGPDGYNKPVSYSIVFGLNIERYCDDWRNILFHGKDDDWSNPSVIGGNVSTVDRTPGIWIYPNTSRLHIKQCSSVDQNSGIDQTKYSFPLGNYAHIGIVVNEISMTIYINGVINETYNLPSNTNFIWNSSLGKSLYLHWKSKNNNSWRCINGYIKINNMYWFNRELSANEITNEFKKTGISSIIAATSSNSSNTPNTVDLGPINSQPWINRNNMNTDWFCKYDNTARWIWNLSISDIPIVTNKDIIFTNYYNTNVPFTATLYIVADAYAIVYLNNNKIDTVSGGWPTSGSAPKTIKISFDKGENNITIIAQNRNGNSAGLLFTFIRTSDNKMVLNSDTRWSASSSRDDVNAYYEAIRAKAAAEAAAAAAAEKAAQDEAAAQQARILRNKQLKEQQDAEQKARDAAAAAAKLASFNPQNQYIRTELEGNRCLSINKRSQMNGARAILANCAGDQSQQWTYNSVDKTLKVKHSNKCLDIDRNGLFIQQWDCWGGENQKWDWNPDTKQLISVSNPDLAINTWANNNQEGALHYGYRASENHANEHWFVNGNNQSYDLRDYVQYTGPDTDLPGQPMTGTVSQCQEACTTNRSCLGFSVAKGVPVDQNQQCWLKKNMNNTIPGQPYQSYVKL